MALPDEKTMSFNLWPNMLMIEGPATGIASLIEALYDDPAIPRDAWNVQHTLASRKEYAQSLRERGEDKARQGMGITPDKLVPVVTARAKSFGLTTFHLSTKIQGAF